MENIAMPENVTLENIPLDTTPVENLEAAPIPTETVVSKPVSFEDLYKTEKKKAKTLLVVGLALGTVGTAVYYNRRYAPALKAMRAEMKEERKKKRAEKKAMRFAAKHGNPVDEVDEEIES